MMMKEDYKRELILQNQKILILLIVLILLMIGFAILLILGDKQNTEDKKEEKLYFENISERKEIGRLHTIEESKSKLYIKVDYPEIGYKEIDQKVSDIVNEKINSADKKYNSMNDKLTYYYFIEYEVYIGNGNIVSLILKDRIDTSELRNIENEVEYHYFSLDSLDEIKREDIFEDGYIDKLKEFNINVSDRTHFIIQGDKIVFKDMGKEVKISDVSDYLKIDGKKENVYPNSIQEKVSTVVNKRMVVTQDVVMYDSDSIDGEIVTTVVNGSTLNVHSNLSNGFSMVFSDGKIGYVDSRYLKEYVEEVVVPPEEIKGIVIDTDRKTLYVVDTVNVRVKPDTSSSKLGQLEYGDKVIQTGIINDWIRIEYNGGEAFIKVSYTSEQEVIRHTIPVDVPPQSNVDPTKPMVALTFDDGPNNTSTVKILDTLEKYNVRATFFDLGNLMLRYPDVVKREAKLGEVATHTYSHKNLNTLTEIELNEEIQKAKDAYKEVLGEYPKLIRPPYGNANVFVRQHITDMAIINWNVDSLDWKYRNKDLTLNEIYKYGDLNGKIILMHSIHAATAETVEILVPELLNRGYQIVTVSELAKYKGYTLQTGTIYYEFK